MPENVKRRYTINRNPGDEDVIHREHPFEECNMDDAEGVERIGAKTGRDLMARDQVQECQHCKPFSGADD